jgi:benzoylformate decarboxylase
MADVNFPNQHPLYFGDMETAGPAMKQLLSSSDLLIGVGCQLFNDAFYTGVDVLPAGLKIIQINDDPWEISKNFPVDCAMLGDVEATVSELCGLLAPDEALQAAAAKRLEVAKELRAQKTEQLQNAICQSRDNCPVSVACLMDEIRQALPQDVLLVDDCWSSSPLLRSILDLKEENTYFRPRNGGSIGYGLPGTMGVKLASPDRPVLGIVGDGSAAWCMQSLWSAAHYRIPATFVILSNATYRQVKCVRKVVLGDYPLNEKHVGMELGDPVIDFAALAQSMGVRGIQARNREELAQALKAAFSGTEPLVIEVFVENNPF